MPQRPHSVKLADIIVKFSGVLDTEEVDTLTAAAQTALRLESGEGFSARGVVSVRDGSPRLDCSWMGMLAQVTPEQARSMALGLMEEAIEAETDSALVIFLRESQVPEDQIGAALFEVRKLRIRTRDPVVASKQEPAATILRNITPLGSKPS